MLPPAAAAYYPTFNFTTLPTKAAWDCISKNITAKPRTTYYPRINSTTAAETLEYFMYNSTVKPKATTKLTYFSTATQETIDNPKYFFLTTTCNG